MFERLTNRARITMALANEEAQRFNHTDIRTEHILIGIVKQPESVAARALTNLGVDLTQLRKEVRRRLKDGPSMVTMGMLPQAPHAKKVIEHAIRAARSLEHSYVGTEHLLLGLLRVPDGVAFETLSAIDVDEESVEREVVAIVGPGGANRSDDPLSYAWPSDADGGETLQQRITRLEAKVDQLEEEIRMLRRRMEED
ncbi:MAG: Clp protease N-terminal domain-containing protein [Planctomycetota bacterium]